MLIYIYMYILAISDGPFGVCGRGRAGMGPYGETSGNLSSGEREGLEQGFREKRWRWAKRVATQTENAQ